jgi:hypothetical protein
MHGGLQVFDRQLAICPEFGHFRLVMRDSTLGSSHGCFDFHSDQKSLARMMSATELLLSPPESSNTNELAAEIVA